MPPFTARNAAKYVVKAIVAAKVAAAAEDAITTHTSLEEDTLAVDLGGKMIGWYVSDKLQPITDAMVDKTADKVAAIKAKRQDKKNTEK